MGSNMETSCIQKKKSWFKLESSLSRQVSNLHHDSTNSASESSTWDHYALCHQSLSTFGTCWYTGRSRKLRNGWASSCWRRDRKWLIERSAEMEFEDDVWRRSVKKEEISILYTFLHTQIDGCELSKYIAQSRSLKWRSHNSQSKILNKEFHNSPIAHHHSDTSIRKCNVWFVGGRLQSTHSTVRATMVSTSSRNIYKSQARLKVNLVTPSTVSAQRIQSAGANFEQCKNATYAWLNTSFC